MASIVLRSFGGMAPSANSKAIAEGVATYAKNTNHRFGDLRPMLLPTNLGTIVQGVTLYRFETAGSFISSVYAVNYVRGPIPTDTTERTYYTGDGAPKVTDNTFAIRQLGVPKPGAAPAIVKIESNAYNADTAAAAMGTKTSEFTSMVWANATLPYVGLESADYTDNFVASVEPWEFLFRVLGTMVSGAFVPTNPFHSALMAPEFGFYLVTLGPTVTGYVSTTLRGQTVVFGAGLATALATIADPSDITGNTDLLSAPQISAIVTDLNDALKPANATRDAAIGRIKILKSEFVVLANAGSAGTVAASKAEMTAFYARTDISSAVTEAINQAAQSIADALDGLSVNYGGL